MSFKEAPPLQRALVVMNALAVLPAVWLGLFLATYLQQWPSHTLWRALLHASPVLLVPTLFIFLTWASLKRRAKWFHSLVAVLLLPAIPFGTVYGAIALKVYWGKRS